MGVDKSGRVASGGAVRTEKTIRFVHAKDRCSCRTCATTEVADGKKPYLMILEGLKEGAVKGITIYFDSEEEAKELLENIKAVEFTSYLKKGHKR